LNKRRQERKNREDFCKMLEEKLASREVNYQMKWREFVEKY